jgi:hypothetical protein
MDGRKMNRQLQIYLHERKIYDALMASSKPQNSNNLAYLS